MKALLKKLFGLGSFRKDEGGAAFILISISLPILIGFTALAVDMGYVFYVKSRLQTAADLGALAGASILYTQGKTTVETKASDYANLNIPTNWNVGGYSVSSTTKSEVMCLDTLKDMGLTCYSTSTGNALKVTVTADTPLFFAAAVGWKSIKLSANSMVTGGGSSPPPLNVAIVVDMTSSMTGKLGKKCADTVLDSMGKINNNPTKIECAIFSAKTLVSKLWPDIDQVAIYAAPAPTAGSIDTLTCKSGNTVGKKPTITQVAYTTAASPTYQIMDFSSSYRPSGSPPAGGLVTTDPLVNMLGQFETTKDAKDNTNCLGLALSSLGGKGTYYADAIHEARLDLKEENKKFTTPRQNVIVVLSDGDATANIESNGTSTTNDWYKVGTNSPNWTIDPSRQMDQCQRAIDEAAAAKSDNIWVYSIAFGADTTTSSCFTDRPYTPSDTYPGTTTTTTCNVGSGNPSCKATAKTTSTSTTVSTPTVVGGTKQQVVTTTTTDNWIDGCTASRCNVNSKVTQIHTDTFKGAPKKTACATMMAIASDTSKFYSTDGSTGCASDANPDFTDLVPIFSNIAASIMKKRRIPNNAT